MKKQISIIDMLKESEKVFIKIVNLANYSNKRAIIYIENLDDIQSSNLAVFCSITNNEFHLSEDVANALNTRIKKSDKDNLLKMEKIEINIQEIPYKGALKAMEIIFESFVRCEGFIGEIEKDCCEVHNDIKETLEDILKNDFNMESAMNKMKNLFLNKVQNKILH